MLSWTACGIITSHGVTCGCRHRRDFLRKILRKSKGLAEKWCRRPHLSKLCHWCRFDVMKAAKSEIKQNTLPWAEIIELLHHDQNLMHPSGTAMLTDPGSLAKARGGYVAQGRKTKTERSWAHVRVAIHEGAYHPACGCLLFVASQGTNFGSMVNASSSSQYRFHQL